MHWLDVAGAPGSGKSTLCDALWGPHDLPIQNRPPPEQWHDFCNEITRLFLLIARHPTYNAALRMNNRSIRKMATVARAAHNGKPYVQTGLVQRGLGFGWRLNDLGLDLKELRHFFRLMPVSLGVAITKCPQSIVEERNHARKQVAVTAHEDRAHMVGLMLPAIEIAKEVLDERGVRTIEIDTTQPISEARAELIAFANAGAGDTAPPRLGSEVSPFSPPPWFQ